MSAQQENQQQQDDQPLHEEETLSIVESVSGEDMRRLFNENESGSPLVTKWGVIATSLGLLFYAADMATDLFTAAQFGYNEDRLNCLRTLSIIYYGVLFHAIRKWKSGGYTISPNPYILLRQSALLLLNWPSFKECCGLLCVEIKLARSRDNSADQQSEWWDRRRRVAELKHTEGVWEAWLQAMLQLELLYRDLKDNVTEIGCMRWVSVGLSLCAAGAAPIFREKMRRYTEHRELPPGELFVLYMWVVSVTVARLLCLVLLQSVHPYWGLACIMLHYALYIVYLNIPVKIPRTLGAYCNTVFTTVVFSLLFLQSPFDNSKTGRCCVVQHAIHFLCNLVVVAIGLYTSLFCSRAELYTAIIIIPVLHGIGMLGWLIHWHFSPWQPTPITCLKVVNTCRMLS